MVGRRQGAGKGRQDPRGRQGSCQQGRATPGGLKYIVSNQAYSDAYIAAVIPSFALRNVRINWIYLGKYDDVELNALIIVVYQPPKSILRSSVSAALTTALKATKTRWAAATIGSQSAAPLELASGKAVMSIGGFNGGDNAPTLAQFEKYVAAGDITYFIAGGQGGGPGGSQASGSAISTWVAAHYTSTTIGGVTVYDLTQAAK